MSVPVKGNFNRSRAVLGTVPENYISNMPTDALAPWDIVLVFQGPISISDETSHRKISWSLEAARWIVWVITSLWNLTGTPAAVLPMCLSNFKAIVQYSKYKSRGFQTLRDLTMKCLVGYWNGARYANSIHHTVLQFALEIRRRLRINDAETSFNFSRKL